MVRARATLKGPQPPRPPSESVKTIEIKVLNYLSILTGGDGAPSENLLRAPGSSVTPLLETTCECERNVSVLRWLKTYIRSIIANVFDRTCLAPYPLEYEN